MYTSEAARLGAKCRLRGGGGLCPGDGWWWCTGLRLTGGVKEEEPPELELGALGTEGSAARGAGAIMGGIVKRGWA